MIVAGDWLVPGDGPALREGAVLVRGSRIAEVGPIDRLRRAHSHDTVAERPGCILAPGLVNAHTHLSLTALSGLLEPAAFHEWLPRLVAAMGGLNAAALQESAAHGVEQCLRAGVTAVGDIGYGPQARAAATSLGLGGVFFWEVLGLAEDALPEALAGREFPVAPDEEGRRSRCGISPHAVYTAGPGLLRAAWRLARARGIPYALHVAESLAELQLLASGDGPLAGVARRTAFGFEPPQTGAAAYLDRLGVLDGAVLVHCVHLDHAEIRLVAARARGVVLCPRSNAFLQNGKPPVEELVRAGVAIALGTDSSASNQDLDLFAEARALRAIAPSLTAAAVVRTLTVQGARVLALDDTLGHLRPGYEADLVAVRTGPTDCPEESFLEAGAAAAVESVMSKGIWRLGPDADNGPRPPIAGDDVVPH